jgi:hypothetical protein
MTAILTLFEHPECFGIFAQSVGSYVLHQFGSACVENQILLTDLIQYDTLLCSLPEG